MADINLGDCGCCGCPPLTLYEGCDITGPWCFCITRIRANANGGDCFTYDFSVPAGALCVELCELPTGDGPTGSVTIGGHTGTLNGYNAGWVAVSGNRLAFKVQLDITIDDGVDCGYLDSIPQIIAVGDPDECDPDSFLGDYETGPLTGLDGISFWIFNYTLSRGRCS